MKKAIFITVLMFLMPIAIAQEQTISAGVTPNNSFFQLDKFFENLQLRLTQDRVKRIDLRIKFLNERVAEYESIAEKEPLKLSKAKDELEKETKGLINETKFVPLETKELVDKGLENSLTILKNLKIRFETDDNPNNNNAIEGLNMAISSHMDNIAKFKVEKDKENEAEIEIKNGVAKVEAVVNNVRIEYKIKSTNPDEIFKDIALKTGGNADMLKSNSRVEIED